MWALVTLLIAGGGVGLGYAITRATTGRALTIAELRPGQWARVVGIARPLAGTIEAPASGRECLAWYAETSDAQAWTWESHAVEMIIEDASGAIIARVNDARVVIRHRVGYLVHLQTERASLRAFVRRFRMKHLGHLNLWEGIICAGDMVAVVARVVAHSEPVQTVEGDGYRGASERIVLELTGGADASVILMAPAQPPS
jgi:hypothetical protein